VIGASRRRLPYAERLVVVRPPDRDDYGDPLPGSAYRSPLDECVVTAKSSNELTDQRDTVVTQMDVYAPLGADVVPTDLVEREDGTTWQVQGAPAVWRSPVSGRGCTHFVIERVTG